MRLVLYATMVFKNAQVNRTGFSFPRLTKQDSVIATRSCFSAFHIPLLALLFIARFKIKNHTLAILTIQLIINARRREK